MKIVIINDSAQIVGGAAQVAIASAGALASRGNEVIFFTATPLRDSILIPSRELRLVTTSQFDILNDPNRLRASIQGVWNFRAIQLLNQILSELDPKQTVVHIHTWVKALSPALVKQVIKQRFPSVCTLHDYFTACPTGSFYLHNKLAICPHKPLSIECITENCDSRSFSHKMWRLGRHFIQSQLYDIPKALRYFIVLSQLSKKVLVPYLDPRSRFELIDNPIDIPKLPPVPVDRNHTFVAVGRLAKEKGLNLLAKASRQLGVRTILVGEGDCRDQLLRINAQLEITGWLSKAEVLKVLMEARTLVFPSLWYEASPLVIREAAALGIPAIVPDTCTAREQVEDGVTGLWFRGGDCDDLALKMQILHNNPGLAIELGSMAYRRYWENPFTLDRHLLALESYYQCILDNSAACENGMRLRQ